MGNILRNFKQEKTQSPSVEPPKFPQTLSSFYLENQLFFFFFIK
jgi:hypothetical protein